MAFTSKKALEILLGYRERKDFGEEEFDAILAFAEDYFGHSRDDIVEAINKKINRRFSSAGRATVL